MQKMAVTCAVHDGAFSGEKRFIIGLPGGIYESTSPVEHVGHDRVFCLVLDQGQYVSRVNLPDGANLFIPNGFLTNRA